MDEVGIYPTKAATTCRRHSTNESNYNSIAGFQNTNTYLRSVLSHPMCFPLLIYLNDIKVRSEHLPEYIWTALDDYFRTTDENTNFFRENLFAATAMDWDNGETDLLLFNINYYNAKASAGTTAVIEEQIVGEHGKKGRFDMIFKQNDTSSVVALLEFGLDNGEWWSKQDQILQYAKMLRTKKNENYTIDQPILLSVITINPNDTIGKNKGYAKKNDEQKNVDLKIILDAIYADRDEDAIGKTPLDAMFGVFLCIPKGDNDFRITLLWRCATTNIRDASTQFGKILDAVQLCSYLSNRIDGAAIDYEYLGTNCCKIGESVRYSVGTSHRVELYESRLESIDEMHS